MNRPPSPENLTAEDAIRAYESAIPLLLDILPGTCSSSCLVREVVWSIYRNHPVGLGKVCCLDQDRKDAVLALINLRMELGGNSDTFIHDLLHDSGELDRLRSAEAQAKELGLRHVFYPQLEWDDPSDYRDMANAAEALNEARRA